MTYRPRDDVSADIDRMAEGAAEAIAAVFHDAPAEKCRWAARLVLQEVAARVDELGTEWTITSGGHTRTEPARAADFKREVLSLLATSGRGGVAV